MASSVESMDMQNETQGILQSISRHVNCLSEENRNTRKRAIEGIKRETLSKKPDLEPQILHSVLKEILKPLLKLVSDPVEKCRELTVGMLQDSVERDCCPNDFLPYIIPVIVQRLGQPEIAEPSEELRLQLVHLLSTCVGLNLPNLPLYFDSYIQILQRTIVDPYPEVKKLSCKCASNVAKTMPEQFHMQSESLIKPLLLTISHQHSRVRVDVINAIGNVIQYGNGKTVDDVVSHLAQRLFDQAPSVRMAVTQIVGNWLLDLPDRYSYHHKLIPLLLTSMTDEITEIRETAEGLWHDVGLKYEGENENELKDKQDWVKTDLEHYPKGVERPNLGCRTLMYRNFSKILSGLVKDITDWVDTTRLKSAQLLYVLLLNEEENATQHLEKVLSGLYKAAGDEQETVVSYVKKSAELIGYFVEPEIWCKMILGSVKIAQNPGPMMVLASVIQGAQRSKLRPFTQDVCNILSDQDVCCNADAAMQRELLACVQALVFITIEDCKDISLSLFTVLVSVLALHKDPSYPEQVYTVLEDLARVQGYTGRQMLFEAHTKQVIDSMQDGYANWSQHSPERLIFDTLLIESGPVVGEILEDIMPMLMANLDPEKNAEIRLKFFSLLSRLMMNAPKTVDSQLKFGDFIVSVIQDMIIPNCVWRAGRTAEAIRTTAVACLWALLQSTILTIEKLLEVLDPLISQLRSLMEDDNKSTRLVTCRSLKHILCLVGTSVHPDFLYNLYPDLLKRLDDSSDDIRVATCQTFLAYFDCFPEGYDANLYRAHLEAMYKGLLIHLDDPDASIQQAVLEVLQKAAHIHPSMLMREVDEVRLKHRTTKFCDLLVKTIQTLPQS